MIEVFKTNVTGSRQAKKLVEIIEINFDGYRANFDLSDCDRVLRIEARNSIATDPVVHLLKDHGVIAEVLTDTIDDINRLLLLHNNLTVD